MVYEFGMYIVHAIVHVESGTGKLLLTFKNQHLVGCPMIDQQQTLHGYGSLTWSRDHAALLGLVV